MRSSLLPVFAVSFLVIAGCELPLPLEPTAGELAGAWTLTTHLARASQPSTCTGEAIFTITEQSVDGALSWSLDEVVTCDPATSDWPHGEHHYHDGWENTAWAVVQGNAIRIQTPDPIFAPSCRYTGTIEEGTMARMSGLVTCQGQFTSPVDLVYRGTWEATRIP